MLLPPFIRRWIIGAGDPHKIITDTALSGVGGRTSMRRIRIAPIGFSAPVALSWAVSLLTTLLTIRSFLLAALSLWHLADIPVCTARDRESDSPMGFRANAIRSCGFLVLGENVG